MNLPWPTNDDVGADLVEQALERRRERGASAGLPLLRQAAEREPDNADAHFNYALALHEDGDGDAAQLAYRRALACDSRHLPSRLNLGVLLKDCGKSPEALGVVEAGLALCPDEPRLLNLLGLLYGRLDEPLRALEACRQACLRAPNEPTYALNLAIAWRELGLLDDACREHRRALALRPTWAEAHWNHGFTLMLGGHLSAGWEELEWRWKTRELRGKSSPLPIPLWAGESLAGKSILLLHEQGLGDTIQFARFVPAVARAAGRVGLRCQPALRRLLCRLEGVELEQAGEPVTRHYDYQAPLMSLPRLLRQEVIADQVPYLSGGRGDRVEDPAGKPRVGLIWRGNAQHQNDRKRSLPLSVLRPLLQRQMVQWVSLQKDPLSPEEREILREVGMADLGSRCDDLFDLATRMERMRLVISVDTAGAHLAGALGVPVWTLLPFAPDWRWMLGRADSPWYPSMRLWRQERAGDWGGVEARLAVALRETLGSPSKAAAAPKFSC